MASLLIVDDDARMRRLIWNIVGDLFDSVRECDDGATAPAIYAEQHPDWVLMDVTMQQVNGLAATRAIRTDDPAARIVIVTGHRDRATRDAALKAGASAYVLKENLLELRELLGDSTAHLGTLG
jgi:CheY-like chemotaxis protein